MSEEINQIRPDEIYRNPKHFAKRMKLKNKDFSYRIIKLYNSAVENDKITYTDDIYWLKLENTNLVSLFIRNANRNIGFNSRYTEWLLSSCDDDEIEVSFCEISLFHFLASARHLESAIFNECSFWEKELSRKFTTSQSISFSGSQLYIVEFILPHWGEPSEAYKNAALAEKWIKAILLSPIFPNVTTWMYSFDIPIDYEEGDKWDQEINRISDGKRTYFPNIPGVTEEISQYSTKICIYVTLAK